MPRPALPTSPAAGPSVSPTGTPAPVVTTEATVTSDTWVTASRTTRTVTETREVDGSNGTPTIYVTEQVEIPLVRTVRVTVPGPTVTRRVPGPTVTKQVPGPTVVRTVPGPTVTKTVPGPTVTRTVQPPRKDPVFFLPNLGDNSSQFQEEWAYRAMIGDSPDCSKAQKSLDELWNQYAFPQWVLIMQAGIYACQDDRQSAEQMMRYVKDEYGLLFGSGKGFFRICDVYRALSRYMDEGDPSCGYDVDSRRWQQEPASDDEDPRRNLDLAKP